MLGPGRFLSTALLAAVALALAVGATVLEVGVSPLSPPADAGDRVDQVVSSDPGGSTSPRSVESSWSPRSGPLAASRATTRCGASSPDAEPPDPPADPRSGAGSRMDLFGPDPKVAAPRT